MLYYFDIQQTTSHKKIGKERIFTKWIRGPHCITKRKKRSGEVLEHIRQISRDRIRMDRSLSSCQKLTYRQLRFWHREVRPPFFFMMCSTQIPRGVHTLAKRREEKLDDVSWLISRTYRGQRTAPIHREGRTSPL